MEFSDFIKSPYVESVTLRIFPDTKGFKGRLCITGHHMIISAHLPEAGSTNVAEVWVSKSIASPSKTDQHETSRHIVAAAFSAGN